MKLVNRFVLEESGQDLIEYGLLVGIITVATVGAIFTLSGKVTGYFDAVNTALTPAS